MCGGAFARAVDATAQLGEKLKRREKPR